MTREEPQRTENILNTMESAEIEKRSSQIESTNDLFDKSTSSEKMDAFRYQPIQMLSVAKKTY